MLTRLISAYQTIKVLKTLKEYIRNKNSTDKILLDVEKTLYSTANKCKYGMIHKDDDYIVIIFSIASKPAKTTKCQQKCAKSTDPP